MSIIQQKGLLLPQWNQNRIPYE